MKKLKLNLLLLVVGFATIFPALLKAENESMLEQNLAVPKIEWVKSEVQKIFSSGDFNNGEKLKDMLEVDYASLSESSVIVAKGHFTSTDLNQFIITVPAKAKTGKNLGWETNVWLLVEALGNNNFKTIKAMRGDVAYQNSIVDVDRDGLQEIMMINNKHTEEGVVTLYKLFSFKSNSVIYSTQTVDNWNHIKIKRRKHLVKSETLYSVLQFSFIDLDGDDRLELVETWVDFKYNGGRRVATIEQRKTMAVSKRTHKLINGVYAETMP